MTLSREQGVKRRRQSESSLVEPPAKMMAANVVEKQTLWNVSLKKLQGCQAVGTERCLRKTVLVYNTLKVIHSTFTGTSSEDTSAVDSNSSDEDANLESSQTSPLLEDWGNVLVAGELVSDEPETLDGQIQLDVYSLNDEENENDCDEVEEVQHTNKETGNSSSYDNDCEARLKRCQLTAREGNQRKRVCVTEDQRQCETQGESDEHAYFARDQHLDVLSSCMMHCCLQTGTSGFRESFYESSSLLDDSLRCANSDVSANNAVSSVYYDDVSECHIDVQFEDASVSALLGCNHRSQASSCALEVANPAGSEHPRLVEIIEN